MVKTRGLWLVSLVGLVPVGCDGQASSEDRYFDRYGGCDTSGGHGCGSSSTSTGGSDDGGGGSSIPDAGDGGWEPTPDAGGWNDEEEDPIYGCFTVGAPTSKPVLPHKIGDYWDQGGSNLCAAIAWVNANIAAGADVPQGVDPIITAVLNCMTAKGHNLDQMSRDGMSNGQREDLRECKDEEMEERGLPVSITHHNFLSEGGDAKELCEELHDVLHPDNAVERPGAAVVAIGHFVWPDNMVELPRFTGHQVQIVDTECLDTTMLITIRDPNYPTNTFVLTVDCNNRVIDTGGHPRFQLGDQIADISIEEPG